MAPHVSVPRHPPNPLTRDLRNLLISGLLSSCAIQKLDTTLVASCQATGWLDAVHERAVQIISSGKCNTYEQVMAALQEESEERWIEKIAAEQYPTSALANEGTASHSESEDADGNWPAEFTNNMIAVRGREEKVDVTISEEVIEDGKKFVKEALNQIVVIEGN